LGRYGKPEIFNTDQGCQFTSAAFTACCRPTASASAMDGRGRWLDNVFIERLWKTVKYEEVYLRAYASVSAAKASLATYFAFYNARRPHTSLARRTPDQIYCQALPLPKAA